MQPPKVAVPQGDGRVQDPLPPIELGEIPAPRAHPVQATVVQPVYLPTIAELDGPAAGTSSMTGLKSWVGRGYFDPFKSFGHRVDWSRFVRGQVFLCLLGLAMPFVTILGLGAVLAVLYSSGAAITSASTPNPFWQVALYPFAFVVLKGYWKAYLLLPASITLLAWIWALLSAWLLTRIHEVGILGFRKAFTIMAMMGASLAPFASFDFLRIVALGFLVWFAIRRFRETFDVGASTFLKTGGIALLAAVVGFGGFERYLESWYAHEASFATELANLRKGRSLAWPPTRPAPPAAGRVDALLARLVSFDEKEREKVFEDAWRFVQSGADLPEGRFRVAHRLAELGHAEAMGYTAASYRDGLGVAKDPARAMDWYRSACRENPRNATARMDLGALMIQQDQRLEGKRFLVTLAKECPEQITRIAECIQRNGWGKADASLNGRISSLYRGSYSPGMTYTYGRNGERQPTSEESLIQNQVNASERNGELWFYRALLAELQQEEPASATVYGEFAEPGIADLESRARRGDRNAMEILGERANAAGDVTAARAYWLEATRALQGDDRGSNSPFYLKLAESCDPALNARAAVPKEAVRWYLAVVLLGAGTGRSNTPILARLGQLGVKAPPNPRSQAFLDLAMGYDVPEAWVMMADRCLAGDFPEVPRNPGRARECLLKAQALGYRSPWLERTLAGLGPEVAEQRRGSAPAR